MKEFRKQLRAFIEIAEREIMNANNKVSAMRKNVFFADIVEAQWENTYAHLFYAACHALESVLKFREDTQRETYRKIVNVSYWVDLLRHFDEKASRAASCERAMAAERDRIAGKKINVDSGENMTGEQGRED